MGDKPSVQETEGDVVLHEPRCEKSVDAGSFYCGHLFHFLVHRSGLTRTKAGQRRAGFLHIPGVTLPVTSSNRFAYLRKVMQVALRGVAIDLVHAGLPARVLVTGFDPFVGVRDNPSGSFVSSAQEQALLQDDFVRWTTSSPTPSSTSDPRLVFARLPVTDACCDAHFSGSMPRLIQMHRPSAVIALGVARSRSVFSVETVPDDAGLSVDGCYHHVGGTPARARGPAALWLANCIAEGGSVGPMQIVHP